MIQLRSILIEEELMFEARLISEREDLRDPPQDMAILADGAFGFKIVQIPAVKVTKWSKFWVWRYTREKPCTVPLDITHVEATREARTVSGTVALNGLKMHIKIVYDNFLHNARFIRAW